jgi:C4-dicarboxylate transporter, DctM subunit
VVDLAQPARREGPGMTTALIGFGVLFLLAFAGVPLGFAMLLTGVGGFAVLRGIDPALGMLGQIVVDSSANYGMSVLPMFILMGLFVHKADISNELYDAANAWLGHLKGGLAHATVAACGLFAAISGSSIATAATMTRVAIPPMRRLGYHDRLSTGSVASAGVLGVLIPPSVPLVIFGLLTETDIRQLFIATIVPGLMLLLLFAGAVWVTVALNPALGPRGERLPMRRRFAALKGVWSTVLLFALVMGGLYGGVFTATESAGIGASGALAIAVGRRRLTGIVLLECLVETARTTAMIFTIVFGALVFANFIVLSGMTGELVSWIQGSGLGVTGVLLAMVVIYLVLGALMEAMGLLLLTAPIFTAVAVEMGVNPIWFGIFVVMLIEIGMLSPPVGMNVFTVKTLLPEVKLSTIFHGVLPFVVANLIAVAVIIAFPALVLAPLRWF